MAYDRYDTRNDPRGDRSRWREERDEGRTWGGRDQANEDRGFFERAGDEIASWFGDDEAERRRRDDRIRDEHEQGWGRRNRENERGRFSASDRDEGRGRFWSDRSWGSGDYDRDSDTRSRGGFSQSGRGWRDVDEDRPRQREMWGSSDRDEGRFGGRRSGGYRPVTGDYGRSGEYPDSEQFFAASGVPRGGFGRHGNDRFEREPSRTPYKGQDQYGRDDYQRTSFAGSQGRESRDFDPHYSSWRNRHMSELDRDYDDYRRENQSRFEDDFGNWRQRRQAKRGLLGTIREHMEVVGSDDEHVGTVDRIAGDRVILAKSDPESGGAHHSLSCSNVDRVEDNRVILDCKADEARRQWRDEHRSRALFEREDQGEMGPRILDRSFEGTYRD